MNDAKPDISVIGLPASGKTTFLAALWHMIRESGAVTRLRFDKFSECNYEHINVLAKRWRAGKKQQRTQTSGYKVVRMRLKDASDNPFEVSFPDMPGEDFSRMWEKRELDDSMKAMLTAPAILLLINGDTIKFPAWIVDHLAIAREVGLEPSEGEMIDWSPNIAPTQVQIVEILQFLMSGELDIGPRRLAILISAWDEVEEEGLNPAELLECKLPLLYQYLRNSRDPWNWHIWGVSAQGGVYEDQDKGEILEETIALRDLTRPSDRIRVVDGEIMSSDITLPLNWLIS